MRKNASLPISLGFSGQTRLIVDQFATKLAATPFGDDITTRTSLIEALYSNGQSLTDARQSTCWNRFARISRSAIRKTFVLSNADPALADCTGEDFDRRFGLGRRAFGELTAALDAFGARNYTMTFLSRSLGEIEDTAPLCDPRLDHRFVGKLSLRSDIRVAASLFGALAEPCLSSACGAYDRSRRLVKAISPDVAIIYRMSAGRALPYGSLTRLSGGFAAFFEGRRQCLTAVSAEHGLYFSNGARWSKDNAHNDSTDTRTDWRTIREAPRAGGFAAKS